MSLDHSTLPDMLATVPHLLSSCIPSWDGQSDTIKVLRLVSKDIGNLVMTALTRCAVQLGAQASHQPQQAVQLLGSCQLQSLTVTLIATRAGDLDGPSLQTQLFTVKSQLEQILQGMGPAISSITTLNLKMRGGLRKEGRSSKRARANDGDGEPRPWYPAPYCAGITCVVLDMLAEAAPALRILCLEGFSGDAGFEAFGSYCPRLAHVQFEAVTVPFAAMRRMARELSSLQSLTMTCPPDLRRGRIAIPELDHSVRACLHAFQVSTSLTKLVLEFHPEVVLGFWPEHATQVPPNLRELVSLCGVCNLPNAPAMLAGLRTLTVGGHSVMPSRFSLTHQVSEVLVLAPDLQTLVLRQRYDSLRDWPVLWHCNSETYPDMLGLKSRLLDGLSLVFSSVKLRGSSTGIQAALAVLPPLPSVHRCTLHYERESKLDADCLKDVARVFPSLTQLCLLSKAEWVASPAMGMALLGPLADCTSLSHLKVQVQLKYTTAGLLELCENMPALEVLGFIKRGAVSRPHLKRALLALGRSLKIEEYTIDGPWEDFDVQP